jgi:hypothetical protein
MARPCHATPPTSRLSLVRSRGLSVAGARSLALSSTRFCARQCVSQQLTMLARVRAADNAGRQLSVLHDQAVTQSGVCRRAHAHSISETRCPSSPYRLWISCRLAPVEWMVPFFFFFNPGTLKLCSPRDVSPRPRRACLVLFPSAKFQTNGSMHCATCGNQRARSRHGST